ncbi:MAG: amidohydrolase family protein, partial [Candidatus Omnitrophica bacterium]|nr:amidohydrolase family protein [Candidatus Omnitrophota bacterium]
MTQPFIIDVHTHLGAAQGFTAPLGATDRFISVMDDTHTAVSIVVAMPLLARQFELGYQEMSEDLEKYPDRLRAYTVYDPTWPELSIEYMNRYQDREGFVGIKIHPAVHAVPPEDERYLPFWEFANERGAIILTHSWSPDPGKPTQELSTPNRFVPLLEKYPNVKLILGHAGGREVGFRMAIEAVNRCENCWVDISGDSFGYRHLEWLVEKMGP